MTTIAEISAPYPALGLAARNGDTPDELIWLDGPKFAAWILKRHPPGRGSGWDDNLLRRIRYWKAGGKASINAADRVLIYVGRSLHEVPTELWTKPPKRQHKSFSEETRKAAVRDHLDGMLIKHVAERYGCSRRSVRAWTDRYADELRKLRL